jgi:hypothetical protein
MQELASRPDLTELALHASGLSCSPALLGDGAFSVLQSLELVVPHTLHLNHQLLSCVHSLTALNIGFKSASKCTRRKRDEVGQLEWQVFEEIRRLTALRSLELDLERVYLDDEHETGAAEALHNCLSQMPLLQRLRLQGAWPWAGFDWSECCSQLSALDFEVRGSSSVEDSVAARVLQSHASLRHLCCLTVALRGVGTYLQLHELTLPSSLTRLTCEDCDEDELDCEWLSNALAPLAGNLKSLDLEVCGFSDASVLVSMVSQLCALTCLRIVATPCVDDLCQELAEAVCHMAGLQNLCLLLGFDAAPSGLHALCGGIRSLRALTSFSDVHYCDDNKWDEMLEHARVAVK